MKLLMMMSMSLLITSLGRILSVGQAVPADDDDEATHHGEAMMTRLLLIILPACDDLDGGSAGGASGVKPVRNRGVNDSAWKVWHEQTSP